MNNWKFRKMYKNIVCYLLIAVLIITLFPVYAKADETPEFKKAENLVYNGSEQALVADDVEGFWYSFDNVNYTKEIPKGINAGEYTFYYNTVSDNAATSTKVEANIAKRPLTIDMIVAEKEIYYTGQIIWNPPTVTDVNRDGKVCIRYEKEYKDYQISGVWGGKELGEYTFKVIATNEGNYSGTIDFNWKIIAKPSVSDNATGEDKGDGGSENEEEQEKYDKIVPAGQKFFVYTEMPSDLEITGYRIVNKNQRKLATITKGGVLTPKKSGIVTIEAYKTVKVGKKKVKVGVGSYTVKIIKPTFDKKKLKSSISGEIIDMTEVLVGFDDIPKDCQLVKWKSSNKKIATIDPETGELRVGARKGLVKISVTLFNIHNNRKTTYSCFFRVNV